MNAKPAIPPTLAALLLAGAVLGVPPSLAAYHECVGHSSGFGEERASCGLTCEEHQDITVAATVDDEGSLYASVQCGGATAWCAGTGACTSVEPGHTSRAETGGRCSATGDGGWYSYVAVRCWAVDARPPQTPQAPAEVRVVVDGAEDLLGAIVESGSSSPPQAQGLAWLTVIEVDDGVPAGLSCARGHCVPVVPTCRVEGERWACGL